MAQDEAADLKFMSNPDRWPRWPVLPVKRRDPQKLMGPDGLGIMVADGKPAVYFANLFDEQSMKDLKNARKIEYPDFDKLVIDWRVD